MKIFLLNIYDKLIIWSFIKINCIRCAFYRTLEYHLEKEFIISEKVEIAEDDYGKKEYRCFVIDGEIANISRFTVDVFHEIEEEILRKLQEILRQLGEVFPKDFVVDIFQYRKENREYIDVVEFNNIHSSGPFLYNSIMEKSEDLLHRDKRKISGVFMDKWNECREQGFMIDERTNLYDVPGTFSHDLRNICVLRSRDGWCHDSIIDIEDFKKHESKINLCDFEEITDDSFFIEKESEREWKEEGLDDEQIQLLKKC